MSPRLFHAVLGALVCLNTAVAGDLQAFALKCIKARAKSASVHILHFGDSHLASAGVQRNFRQVFQAQFGNGGLGFGLPWVKPQPGVTAQASSGWHRSPKSLDGALAGLQGAWFEANRAGESARLEAPFSRLRIHFLGCPGGGTARILVDGQFLGEVPLQADAPVPMFFGRELSPRAGSRRLDVITTSPGPVRILGVSLEEPTGAVHSFLAANGRQAAWMLDVPESLFKAQIQAEAPDLVILAFGTNEANGRLFDPALYQKDLETLLSRFQKAAPGAALVLTGPPDANLPRAVPDALNRVIGVQRLVSDRYGAFFWDQREAMGGPGSIEEWSQVGHANRDLVHFTPEGYQRLEQMFLEHFFARLGQLNIPDAAPFAIAPLPRRAAATAAVPPAYASGTQGHPIFVFKTLDGRTIITDDPSTVANEQGEWVGRKP